MGNSARMWGGAPRALAATVLVTAGRVAHAQQPAPAEVPPREVRFVTAGERYEVAAVPEESHECQAPCTLRLPAGRWRVEAHWPGGATAVNDLQISAGTTIQRGYRSPATMRPQPPRTDGSIAAAALGGAAIVTATYGIAALVVALLLSPCPPSSACADVPTVLTATGIVSGIVLTPVFGVMSFYAVEPGQPIRDQGATARPVAGVPAAPSTLRAGVTLTF